jgi:hypothetical protein
VISSSSSSLIFEGEEALPRTRRTPSLRNSKIFKGLVVELQGWMKNKMNFEEHEEHLFLRISDLLLDG